MKDPSEASPAPPSFGEQSETGVDISLLRANLLLTPEERIEKHMRALNFVLEVRRAGQQAGLFVADKGS